MYGYCYCANQKLTIFFEIYGTLSHFSLQYSLYLLSLVSVECVENKLCPGTECQEIKPSTSDKGGSQASRKGTVPDATLGNR